MWRVNLDYYKIIGPKIAAEKYINNQEVELKHALHFLSPSKGKQDREALLYACSVLNLIPVLFELISYF